MTDLFSELALGEALVEELVLSFKAENAITKGQLCKMSTHTAGAIGSVTPVAADNDLVIGVAMKNASAGDYVPLLVKGIIKVKSSGAITLGNAVKAEYSSDVTILTLVVAGTHGDAYSFGKALQTFADEDEGLVLIDCAEA